MRLGRLLGGVLGVLVVAAGCGEVDDELFDDPEFAQSEDGIRGGQVDNGRSGVMGLLINTPQGQAICSSSLIAPNLLLTAHHCIAELASEEVSCTDRFGSVYNADGVFATTETDMQGGGYIAAREIMVPEVGGLVCGTDLALILLQSNVPGVLPYAPRVDEPLRSGEMVTAAGYGHIGDGSGAGIRRSVSNQQILCVGPECSQYQELQGVLGETEFVAYSSTCQGDSGGPAIDSQNRITGALSRGDQGCETALYSDVYSWRDWVREHGERAAQIGGYQPPAWVGIAPPDTDNDGIDDSRDNCLGIVNSDQLDGDLDGIGDACDEPETEPEQPEPDPEPEQPEPEQPEPAQPEPEQPEPEPAPGTSPQPGVGPAPQNPTPVAQPEITFFDAPGEAEFGGGCQAVPTAGSPPQAALLLMLGLALLKRRGGRHL